MTLNMILKPTPEMPEQAQKGQERQFDSQSAVKQADPSAKRLPLPIMRILNSKLEILS